MEIGHHPKSGKSARCPVCCAVCSQAPGSECPTNFSSCPASMTLLARVGYDRTASCSLYLGFHCVMQPVRTSFQHAHRIYRCSKVPPSVPCQKCCGQPFSFCFACWWSCWHPFSTWLQLFASSAGTWEESCTTASASFQRRLCYCDTSTGRNWREMVTTSFGMKRVGGQPGNKASGGKKGTVFIRGTSCSKLPLAALEARTYSVPTPAKSRGPFAQHQQTRCAAAFRSNAGGLALYVSLPHAAT